MAAFNKTRGTLLANRVTKASSFIARMCGLLFRPPLVAGQGLYLTPCCSIHMFGMKYPIDVVFLSKSYKVVGIVEKIAPGSISPFYFSAHSCLELPAGTILTTGTEVGDELLVSYED